MPTTQIIEFLTKLQEGATIIADACQEYLETLSPVETRRYGNFDGLNWERKMGTRAEYFQTTKEANENSREFQALQAKLQEKGGFWPSKNYKFWLHRGDVDVIDRRRKENE